MAMTVDHCAFLLGLAAPQNKHQMVTGGIEARDHRIGEWLPSLAGMGAGTALLDCQAGI